MFVYVHSMTFAQRRNRLTTHFSGRIPVVKRRMTLFGGNSILYVTTALLLCGLLRDIIYHVCAKYTVYRVFGVGINASK